MADLKRIDDYIPTLWQNFIAPSIDQDNLNHIEKSIRLNRDTINLIISKLGERPTDIGSNSDIYDATIYDTLIKFKNLINGLQASKLDLDRYVREIGDITELKSESSNIVGAINDRLRNDIDDASGSNHTYTFKKLILKGTNSNGEDSLVIETGNVLIYRNTTIKGSLTSEGTIQANNGIKVNNGINVNNGDIVVSSGKITANGGNFKETLTVKNLVVNGTLSVSRLNQWRKYISSKDNSRRRYNINKWEYNIK